MTILKTSYPLNKTIIKVDGEKVEQVVSILEKQIRWVIFFIKTWVFIRITMAEVILHARHMFLWRIQAKCNVARSTTTETRKV